MWRVSSETGPLRDVLVCSPDHYRWLPTNSIARRTLGEARQRPAAAHLLAAHAELVHALEQGGARVHRIAPEPHLPYMAYTRDSVVVTHAGPVLCQLERPQRRGEYAPLLDWHAARAGPADPGGTGPLADPGGTGPLADPGGTGPFWRKSSAGTLEGGDVHILRPGVAAVGVSGGRTDADGAAQFAAWLRAEGWEVRVEPFDEHFLHLDVLFCMAAPGLAVACTEALDPAFLGWLRGLGIRWLDVPYREAMALGCNLLALGGERVVSTRGSTHLNQRLRAEGLEVLDPDLTLFALGGGGPHCLTCPLARDPE